MPSSSSSTLPDHTDFVLGGRYKLNHVLGSGSFGVVYHAFDRIQRSDVAVKVIPKSNKKRRGRLEVTLHQRASLLPNVVKLHGFFEDSENLAIVMDLCRGGSLWKQLKTRGPITDERRLRALFLGIVDAVSDLHRAGIYHRDLKPENILLGSEGGTEVFLADFGLASRSKCYSARRGTRAYMSPELLGMNTNQPSSSADSQAPNSVDSDIWALGIILLHLVSGTVPWSSASLSDPNYAAFVRNPGYLLDVLPISPGLNEIVRGMLHVNPCIRMSLSDVRRNIAELDTFFCDVTGSWLDEFAIGQMDSGLTDDTLSGLEPLQAVAARANPCPNQGLSCLDHNMNMMRSMLQSAWEILCVRQGRQDEMEEMEVAHRAGSARSSNLDFSPNTAAKLRARDAATNNGVLSGTSSGRRSSTKRSTMVATPGDSDVVTRKRDIGKRMRGIASRVKIRFHFR